MSVPNLSVDLTTKHEGDLSLRRDIPANSVINVRHGNLDIVGAIGPNVKITVFAWREGQGKVRIYGTIDDSVEIMATGEVWCEPISRTLVRPLYSIEHNAFMAFKAHATEGEIIANQRFISFINRSVMDLNYPDIPAREFESLLNSTILRYQRTSLLHRNILLYIARIGAYNFLEVLIRNNFSVNVMDDQGRTPFDFSDPNQQYSFDPYKRWGTAASSSDEHVRCNRLIERVRSKPVFKTWRYQYAELYSNSFSELLAKTDTEEAYNEIETSINFNIYRADSGLSQTIFMLSALYKYSSSLTSLRLANNAIVAAPQFLSYPGALRVLTLEGTPNSELWGDFITKFSESLGGNHTLEQLKLKLKFNTDFAAYDRRLAEKTLTPLGAAINRNDTLTMVDLGSIDLTDEVAIAFLGQLTSNRTLRHLSLAGNNLSAKLEVACALNQAVSRNRGICFLDLSGNPLTVPPSAQRKQDRAANRVRGEVYDEASAPKAGSFTENLYFGSIKHLIQSTFRLRIQKSSVYGLFSSLVAFYRANRGNHFVDSIDALIPTIARFANFVVPLETRENLKRVIDTQYFTAQVGEKNPEPVPDTQESDRLLVALKAAASGGRTDYLKFIFDRSHYHQTSNANLPLLLSEVLANKRLKPGNDCETYLRGLINATPVPAASAACAAAGAATPTPSLLPAYNAQQATLAAKAVEGRPRESAAARTVSASEKTKGMDLDKA